MWSDTLKKLIVFIAISMFVASFILGNVYPVKEIDSYGNIEEKFNFGAMIYCWVADFFFVIFSLCISAILEHLENTSNFETLLIRELNDIVNKKEPPKKPLQETKSSYLHNPVDKFANLKSYEKWTCRNCGEENSGADKFCKYCKEHR